MESTPEYGARLADLDPALLRRAREAAGLASASDLDYLVQRRLAHRRGEELVLCAGAVLLFAREATAIEHPNAGVRVFRVDGTERLTGARHNVRELPRVEGALPRVIEQAYAAIGAQIRRSTRLHDLFFREMPEYPTFAWQEALVNAVAHRDYRTRGRGVEVWIFDDRLEIISPGGLVPEVEVLQLRRRERVHCSRNARLTRVLAELSLMREQGEGIPRMFEEMEQSLLLLPELRAEGQTFTVVLRNKPIFDTPDPVWVRYVRSLPIGHRQRRALVAYPGGAIANSDYQTLNDVDRDTAYRELRELVEIGLLAPPAGRGRGARYRVLAPIGADAPRPSPRRVLAARMEARGSIRNADLREVFGVGRREATRTLGRLVEEGVLSREGERRAARYTSGPAWGAWVQTLDERPHVARGQERRVVSHKPTED